MPPRFVTVAIVVFWLATLGWFFQHDLWPRLRPGQRPPYTLDLAREVTDPADPRRWTVFHNGSTIGQALTWVEYRARDDTYALTSRFTFQKFKVATLDVQRMASTYRVTRDGRLREVDVEVEASSRPTDPGGGPKAHVHGIVEDGVFRWEADSPLLGGKKLTAQSLEVAGNHRVLSPMQPWDRLLDVQENRTWQIELFDPLAGALSNLLPGGLGQDASVRTLEAGVLQGTENRTWNNAEVPCLVIEYRGEGVTGKTYVRQSDGLVLRQEATRNDDQMALERIPR